MLMGEYHHNLDDKNRLIIPAKFREELGDEFVMTRGLDGCLFIYPKDNWVKIVEHLKSLPFTKQDARNFSRFFLSGATTCEFDKQGRIIIASSLIEYASLNSSCVIVGVLDRLEIWAEERWRDFMQKNEAQLTNIAEHLFDANFEEW